MQAIQSAKRMMNTFRAAKNPDAALQLMAQKNPQIENSVRPGRAEKLLLSDVPGAGG